MTAANPLANGAIRHWVVVHPEPSGQYTARAAGLPEVAATAATREKALRRVHELLQALVMSGRLVALELPPGNPLLEAFGCTDPNDPHERAYVEELARLRQEDLEQTLGEYDQPCSDSSSTPTT